MHIRKELFVNAHGVESLRGKLCHHNVEQSRYEFSGDLSVNGLLCNEGEIVATFLEFTVLTAMTIRTVPAPSVLGHGVG